MGCFLGTSEGADLCNDFEATWNEGTESSSFDKLISSLPKAVITSAGYKPLTSTALTTWR